MALDKGTKAPEFTLKRKTADGLVDVALKDNLGKRKQVLLFFPLAFTGVCTNEMCSITQDLGVYEKLDAAVYGISVDSPFAQEAWAKQNKISLPLLSDFNKEVAAAYGVLYDLLGFKGVSKRAAFVVDKKGTIVYAWYSDDPHNLPDFKAIQDALRL